MPVIMWNQRSSRFNQSSKYACMDTLIQVHSTRRTRRYTKEDKSKEIRMNDTCLQLHSLRIEGCSVASTDSCTTCHMQILFCFPSYAFASFVLIARQALRNSSVGMEALAERDRLVE